jgi:beta-glucuronidase
MGGTQVGLYPHESATRSCRDLSGIWRFRLDPQEEGERSGWSNGLADTRAIAVPGSWNDLFDDARDYFGTAWYEAGIHVDAGWQGRRIFLRFGSANYRARAWLNGQLLGEHVGGHLPFTFEVTAAALPGAANRLVVMVENKLAIERVPSAAGPAGGTGTGGFPDVTFDFFPYAGLHRPVLLHATPWTYIDDLTITTTLAGSDGHVTVDLQVHGNWHGSAELGIALATGPLTVALQVQAGRGRATLTIPGVRPWSPEDPHLYALTVRIGHAPVVDTYHLKVGVRTVAVQGDQLLLNGKPVQLRGFGKHEDFPIHGRGLDLPVLVRDFELLKWIGANSFRTSHYPYSDEAMMLADEYGLLVIAETPGVSLGFADAQEVIDARQRQLAAALAELLARDKNHPCVIMWSIANEPGLGQAGSRDAAAIERSRQLGLDFFRPLFAQARGSDPTRPVVLVSYGGGPDDWAALGDLICTNYYYGWYSQGGQLEGAARTTLAAALDRLRARHGKPIIVTEFGAEALPGSHAQPATMWSEEYQADMLRMYVRELATRPYVVGTHAWAFADFRSTQGVNRADGLNHKGVFTRERQPKLAAHALRASWRGS